MGYVMKGYIKFNRFIVSMSRVISYIGAAWIFLLMILIVVDVIGRLMFNSPLVGTSELVRNSVVGIAFFLIPWAMVNDTHVRSTILIDHVSKKVSKPLDIMAYIIGLLLFVAIVITSWEPFLTSFINKEFEGEGALRVLTWPTRLGILLGCTLTAWHCINTIITKIFSNRFIDFKEGGE